MAKREHKCGCVVVSGHADDDAIRGVLTLDLDPIWPSGAVAPIGSFGDDSFNGRNTDRASGRTIAVSAWDTEDHVRFTLDTTGDVPSRLQAAGLQVESTEIFEVTTT